MQKIMKNIFVLIIFLFLNILATKGQFQNTTVQTPTGVNIAALRFTGTDFSAPEIAAQNYNWTYAYNCRILANSTWYYNCHAYAWHNIEGRMGQSDLRWINDIDQDENPIYNVTKYYSGADPSYMQTTTVTNHLRVSYFPRDHSAVTTEDQDSVISKWSYGPLVKHTLAQCPFYSDSQIKYYKLQLQIDGSSAPLCGTSQRTFTSEISIPGSTYSWTYDDDDLDYVNGAGTTSYTVEGENTGYDTWVGLQITTPSGEVTIDVKKFFCAGVPAVDYIDGPYSYNPYSFYAMPTLGSSGISYSWDVDPYAYISSWMYHADITFNDPGYYYITATASNVCGSNWAYKVFYHGGRGFSMSPNPAYDEVEITIKEVQPEEELEDALFSEQEYIVTITDINGIPKSQKKYSGKKFTIPVQHLKDGNYFVKLSNDKMVATQQLVIKR